MKYFLYAYILLSCFILSCKSFDNSLLLNKEIIDKDIKSMHVIVNYESVETCLGDYKPEELIYVIKNNLTFETEPENYYLSIIVRKADYSQKGWVIPSVFTLFIFNLFGGPANTYTYTIELEGAIMNRDGRILKAYNAKGTDSEYMALYWGYDTWEGTYTAKINAITNACKDIRTQLKNDVININKLVK
jgi:hypothetical protein